MTHNNSLPWPTMAQPFTFQPQHTCLLLTTELTPWPIWPFCASEPNPSHLKPPYRSFPPPATLCSCQSPLSRSSPLLLSYPQVAPSQSGLSWPPNWNLAPTSHSTLLPVCVFTLLPCPLILSYLFICQRFFVFLCFVFLSPSISL